MMRIDLGGLSVRINKQLGGIEGYTVCAQLYLGRLNGSRKARVATTIIDAVFWRQEHHCRKSFLKRTYGIIPKGDDEWIVKTL